MHLCGMSMNLQVSAGQWAPHVSVLVPLAPSSSFSLHTYKGALLASSHSAAKPCAYPIIPRPSGSWKTLWGLLKKGYQKSPMCALVHVYISKHQLFPSYAPTMQINHFQCHCTELWSVISHICFHGSSRRGLQWAKLLLRWAPVQQSRQSGWGTGGQEKPCGNGLCAQECAGTGGNPGSYCRYMLCCEPVYYATMQILFECSTEHCIGSTGNL